MLRSRLIFEAAITLFAAEEFSIDAEKSIVEVKKKLLATDAAVFSVLGARSKVAGNEAIAWVLLNFVIVNLPVRQLGSLARSGRANAC